MLSMSVKHQLMFHSDSHHLSAYITHDNLCQCTPVCFAIHVSSVRQNGRKFPSSIMSGMQVVFYMVQVV